MAPTLRFALNFSSHAVAQQARDATTQLAAASPAAHEERARLYAILAAASLFTDPDGASAAASAASREADRAATQVARAWTLIAECVVDVSPHRVHQRLEHAREVLRIGQASGEVEFVSPAFFLYLGALAELGLISELDLALSETGTYLSVFPWLEGERHVAWFRCLRATIDGQVEQAEQIASRACEVAQEQGDPDAERVWVGQLAIIRWMQGRVVELEPAFLYARQSAPQEQVWAVSLAWMWLLQGRTSAARSLITALPPFSELPLDRNWLATACILADSAARLRELEIAAAVREALLPFEDRLVTIGLGVTCWGTVSRPLALLAEALGDTDAAVRHYRRAIHMAGKVGAQPWLAEAQSELAALLANRADDGDLQEAFALASEAAATGRALKLHSIELAASGVLAALRASEDTAEALPEPTLDISRPQINVFGPFEVTAADGTVARWQSRKARQLLKILVARRGVAISRETLMDLLWPDEAPSKVANRFSVAMTTVRRALDPDSTSPRDAYIQSAGSVIRLRIERIAIDLEQFHTNTAHALSSLPLTPPAAEQLATTLELHRGDVLADEPEALWAEQLRSEVHLAYLSASHALAEAAQAMGDGLTRLECYRRILAIDGFDQRAHEGLIDALTAMGAHGQAAAARHAYEQHMAELSIPTGT